MGKMKFGNPTMWTVVGALMAGFIAWSLFREDKIEVIDLEWKNEKSRITVTFEVRNNSHERQEVALLLILQRYSSSTTSNGYSVLKTKEISFEVDSNGSIRVSEAIEHSMGSWAAGVVVSVEILSIGSNKPLETTSANAAASQF